MGELKVAATVLLLTAVVMTGCVAPEATTTAVAETEGSEVRFAWSPERPREGEPVHFAARAPAGGASWSWSFGDGASGQGPEPRHAYAAAGTYRVEAVVSFTDGRTAAASATVQVAAAAAAQETTQAPVPGNRGGGEAGEAGVPEVRLAGPVSVQTGQETILTVEVRDAPSGSRLAVDSECDRGPCTDGGFEGSMEDGVHEVPWTPASSGLHVVTARLVVDGSTRAEDRLEVEAEAAPRQWPEPQVQHVRPGDYHSPSGCTLNFVFTDRHERYFFGSAAHCRTGSAADGSLWDCSKGDFSPEDGATTQAGGLTLTVAYHSWGTMHRVGETDNNICRGNDFMLLEVAPGDVDRIHPAVRMYGGPTGLGSITDLSSMHDLRSYGRSPLHDDSFLLGPENSVLNPKVGHYLGRSYGGWAYHVYMLPQGVFGDSGSGLMDVEGRAHGIASTISLLGGSNNYSNLEWALQYMEQHEGWAPTLVTWDDWDPEPRLP